MPIVKVLFFRVENGGVVHLSPDVLHNVTPNSVPSTDVYPDSTHSSLDGIYSILCFLLTSVHSNLLHCSFCTLPLAVDFSGWKFYVMYKLVVYLCIFVPLNDKLSLVYLNVGLSCIFLWLHKLLIAVHLRHAHSLLLTHSSTST